jgi:hypothetical protein
MADGEGILNQPDAAVEPIEGFVVIISHRRSFAFRRMRCGALVRKTKTAM